MKNFGIFALMVCLAGCSNPAANNSKSEYPVFTFGTSEYPSWYMFVVAANNKLFDPHIGTCGIEKQYGIDIVLSDISYDGCLQQYAVTALDAICVTNVDIVPLSQNRASSFILPTSTSFGGDQLIAVDGVKLEDLDHVPVHGLDNSVSEFVFRLGLKAKGIDPNTIKYVATTPETAQQCILVGDPNVKAVMLWHPYAQNVYNSKSGLHRILDSSLCEERVIDGVAIGSDVLKRPQGNDFAQCLVDIYYESQKMLAEDRQETLRQLGIEFSNLSEKDMETIVQEVHFYEKSEGLSVFESDRFQKETMSLVVDFQNEKKQLNQQVRIGFNDPTADLNITTAYLKNPK